MTKIELEKYLKSKYPKEDHTCEHKEFKTLKQAISGRKGEDVISYVSALSNMEGGVLVLGVKDGSLEVVGIDDTSGYTAQELPQRLVGNCTNLSSEGLSVEEFITSDTKQKVWIIHIPKHQPRKPVYAHKIAWQRSGESIIPLTPQREAVILSESLSISTDWSAKICQNAVLDDLSKEAIAFAKEEYKTKHSKLSDEVDSWSDEQFLAKAKLLKNGKITNACMLLLGKDEKSDLLEDINPQITWILKDENNIEQSYEHFGLPFLLSTKSVLNKIRNFKYRFMSENKLFPEEVDKYDTWVLYEALHNAIAHQDYELRGRINVVEFPDKVVISNVGDFLAGEIEEIIKRDTPLENYRNDFLCKAMVEINMIDTIGSGIKRMFVIQKQRFFPMPDYLIDTKRVQVTIYGKIIDEKYTKLLALNPDIDLIDLIHLDKIAKKQPVNDEIIKNLKAKKLIEGRKPNLYISATVAQSIGEKAQYSKNKAFEKQYYLDLILKSITQHGYMTRMDIDKLLWDKLPDYMDEQKKKIKINNLINELSNKLKKICNKGSKGSPKWEFSDD
jgi:ATP-dependent DNA helicase RecG